MLGILSLLHLAVSVAISNEQEQYGSSKLQWRHAGTAVLTFAKNILQLISK
jgi:hypothetical protein